MKFKTFYEKDAIPGGIAANKPDSDFDPVQLKIGIGIEMEHTNSKTIAKEIAKDHLSEDPNYYKKLIKYVEPKSK